MLNLFAEDRPFEQWVEYIRKQQVRDSAKLVPGCGMPGDIHAQAPQLLNQPPYFGAVGADFLSELCAAHHNRGIARHHLDNAAQARVRFLETG